MPFFLSLCILVLLFFEARLGIQNNQLFFGLNSIQNKLQTGSEINPYSNFKEFFHEIAKKHTKNLHFIFLKSGLSKRATVKEKNLVFEHREIFLRYYDRIF